MKQTYSKPMIVSESLDLNTIIATSCNTMYQWTEGEFPGFNSDKPEMVVNLDSGFSCIAYLEDKGDGTPGWVFADVDAYGGPCHEGTSIPDGAPVGVVSGFYCYNGPIDEHGNFSFSS